MGDVFDLDAIAGEGEPFAWKFGGEDFEFPSDPSIESLEFLAKGDLQQCLYALLGEDEYGRLDALPARMGRVQFQALIERYYKHAGIDQGKSSRPSKSARQTRSARAVR